MRTSLPGTSGCGVRDHRREPVGGDERQAVVGVVGEEDGEDRDQHGDRADQRRARREATAPRRLIACLAVALRLARSGSVEQLATPPRPGPRLAAGPCVRRHARRLAAAIGLQPPTRAVRRWSPAGVLRRRARRGAGSVCTAAWSTRRRRRLSARLASARPAAPLPAALSGRGPKLAPQPDAGSTRSRRSS